MLATTDVVGIPSASSQEGRLEEESHEASDVNLHFWLTIWGMLDTVAESTLLIIRRISSLGSNESYGRLHLS